MTSYSSVRGISLVHVRMTTQSCLIADIAEGATSGHSLFPSLNCVGASLSDLSIVFRVHARYADTADNLAIDHNRDAALHQIDIWHGEVPQARTAPCDDILQGLGRPAKLNRGKSFAL